MALITILLCFTWPTFGQNEGTANLVVISGGNVPINFLRFEHYDNGVTLSPGSEFGVTVTNDPATADDVTGFELLFKAFNSGGTISSNSNTIPVDQMRVKAENSQNLSGAGFTYDGWRQMSTNFKRLMAFDNSPNPINFDYTNRKVNIFYEAGNGSVAGINDFIGEQPGFYTVQIKFRLDATFN